MGTLKLIMAAIFILSGCATNPTEGMTPAEAKAYKVQAEYVRANNRILKNEAILTASANCKVAGMIWYAKGFSPFDYRRMERDPTWLPKNAHPFDFSCVSQAQLNAYMRRAF